MPVEIARERPDTPDAAALVAELEAHLASRYPDENRHGFSVARLLAEDVRFLVLREDGAAAACGGLLVTADAAGPYGEVKRMYTRPAARGRGHGRRILEALLADGRAAGLRTFRLETGIDQVEAIALYESLGFQRCAPFGPYRDDPLSPCYELRDAPAGPAGPRGPRGHP